MDGGPEEIPVLRLDSHLAVSILFLMDGGPEVAGQSRRLLLSDVSILFLMDGGPEDVEGEIAPPLLLRFQSFS